MRSKAVWVWVLALTTGALGDTPQAGIPPTAGETLSGKRIVLAEAIKGHEAVLVAGFSKTAGDGCGEWLKALRADKAVAGASIYEIAELEGAPSLLRGMIKGGMKKGVVPAEQDSFVVLTEDTKAWKSFFQVNDDQAPQVVIVRADGSVAWRGHGKADQEPQVRDALK